MVCERSRPRSLRGEVGACWARSLLVACGGAQLENESVQQTCSEEVPAFLSILESLKGDMLCR